MPTPPIKSIKKSRPWMLDLCVCGKAKQKLYELCQSCRKLKRRAPLSEIPQPDELAIRHIPLLGGGIAIVDAEDYEKLAKFRWKVANGYGKLATHEGTLMHRMITDAPPECSIDHANHVKLDNRKSNLRVCSQADNSRNTVLAKNNTSGVKGVSFCRRTKRWMAAITVDYKSVFLGRFPTKEAAAQAYDRAATELHGQFALTNQQMGLLTENRTDQVGQDDSRSKPK